MAGRIPSEFIDELLERVDILDLIGSRLQLRKAGKDYQARCPFHEEKSPSFNVIPAKQFYYCFGCGAHGNAIDFLMEYDRLEFREAVAELARSVGMDVPHGEGGVPPPDHRPLFELLERAATLYRKALAQSAEAIDYLKGRGIDGRTAVHFGLGFAPGAGDFLLARLGQNAAAREALISCGLVAERDGRVYDQFRHRITFPIRDRRGRVCGFGARALGEAKPKYLNSPETPVFQKRQELYGLFEACQAQRRLESLLIVEGYFDVIALAQHGVSNAVATLGTATSTEHLQRLLRTAPELVFCFDGDRAGRAAAWKALEVALPLATGHQSLRFLFLDEGDDPDSLIRRTGAEAFKARLDAAGPLSEFLFEHLAEQVDHDSVDGRARLASLATPLLERMPQGIYRELLQAELQRRCGLRPTQQDASMHPRPARRQAQSLERSRLSLVAQIIAMLLARPHLANSVLEIDGHWRHSEHRGIAVLAELIDSQTARPAATPAALIERWRGRAHFDYLQRLTVAPFLADLGDEQIEAEFLDALRRLALEARKRERLSALAAGTAISRGDFAANDIAE